MNPQRVTPCYKNSLKKMASLLDIFEQLSDCSLWAMDETARRLESDNFYSWGPKGKYRHIERNGVKKGLNIIGATEIKDKYHYLYDTYEKGTENAQNITSCEVIKFIEQILHYDQDRGIKKTFIILDNAGFHRSQEVRSFAKEHKDSLYLIFQPKYSPQLNPQENMWKWLKNYLASNRAYGTITELKEHVEKFASYVNNNLALVEQRVGARHYYK